jgi:pimeloyl-ACP methyl ester carboxylesterase
MRDRPDRSGELASIPVPTLVIVGEQDAITPPDVATKMYQSLTKGQLVTITGAGHMACMEQPHQVMRAIRDFVSPLA